jgi:hypothetical protein
MKSRKAEKWCYGNPDCDNPKNLCMGMVSDYKAAVMLKKEFPRTFK